MAFDDEAEEHLEEVKDARLEVQSTDKFSLALPQQPSDKSAAALVMDSPRPMAVE